MNTLRPLFLKNNGLDVNNLTVRMDGGCCYSSARLSWVFSGRGRLISLATVV